MASSIKGGLADRSRLRHVALSSVLQRPAGPCACEIGFTLALHARLKPPAKSTTFLLVHSLLVEGD
jgi:hypothetical protein